MFEAGLMFAICLACVGAGLALWRFIAGPARRRFGPESRVISVSLAVALVVPISAWRLSKSRSFQCFGGMVPRVDTSTPVVALTFDDGPSPEYTEEVLSVLREHQVRATFFVTGQALEENMAAARSIVAQGHELGNHSYSHQHMILKSYSFVQQEIESTDRLIREAGYEGDIHFRSPYGKRLIVLPYYLHRTGRLNIFFDVEPESYPEVAADAGRIVEHVLDEARPGSIILLHVMVESRATSREALPGIVQGLEERGFSFVTVSELLTYESTNER
jgi:peptidoglycan/xylan/chitin deacetylase (PgdA/CDA1 family)